jgi:hypothetical protein
MKDQKDRSTGDLLTTPGARRQAALKARREADGFKRSTVWIKQADYDAGKLAAELGSTNASDAPEDRDRLSWMLGYCEHLERAAKSRAEALAKRKGAK